MIRKVFFAINVSSVLFRGSGVFYVVSCAIPRVVQKTPLTAVRVPSHYLQCLCSQMQQLDDATNVLSFAAEFVFQFFNLLPLLLSSFLKGADCG